MEMQGGVLVAKKERGGFGLATFATGIVYGLQVRGCFMLRCACCGGLCWQLWAGLRAALCTLPWAVFCYRLCKPG